VIVLFPLLAVTEELAEIVDIKDAVLEVVFSEDAPGVGLESIAEITTGVFVDSPGFIGGRLIVGGGLFIRGKRVLTETILLNMLRSVSTYDILTWSLEII